MIKIILLLSILGQLFALNFQSSLGEQIVSVLINFCLISLVYLYTRLLSEGENNNFFPMMAVLFVAVSPWLLLNSVYFRVNNLPILMALIIGIFYLLSLRNIKVILLALLLTLLSTVVVRYPLNIPILFLSFGSLIYVLAIKKIKNYLFILTFLLVIILSLLLNYKIVKLDLTDHFKQNTLPIFVIEEQRREHGSKSPVIAKALHNKVVNYSIFYLEHYFNYFTGDFLFIVGDLNINKKIPEVAVMNLYSIIFLPVGIYFILKKIKKWVLILLWLLLAPLYPALTLSPPSMLNGQLMFIPLEVVSAYGVSILIILTQSIRNKFLSYLSICLIFVLIAWEILRFYHQYIYHFK